MTEQQAIERVNALKRAGFDSSSYDDDDNPRNFRVYVSCSACWPVTICGIPAHERGCPHMPRCGDDAN